MPGSPNTYTVICDMHNTSDPTLKFRNTYDVLSATAPNNTDPFMDAIMHFQTSMLDADCTFDEMRVYTWFKGAQPYPQGLPLFIRTVNAVGDADLAWAGTGGGPATGGEVCLRIDRTGLTQIKPGRWFFRSTIRDADVQAISGGRWVFSSGGAARFTQAHLDAIVTASGFGGILSSGADVQKLVLVPYSKKHGTVGSPVEVAQVVLVGPTTNKTTRKNKK